MLTGLFTSGAFLDRTSSRCLVLCELPTETMEARDFGKKAFVAFVLGRNFMKLIMPPRWVLGCLCVSPAAMALLLVKVLYVLESKGEITGEPSMGVAPMAGFFTLMICIGGSLLPAIWLNKKRECGATFYYWVGLSILNVIIAAPGCAIIGH